MPHLIQSFAKACRAMTRWANLRLCWHRRRRSGCRCWKGKHLVQRCLIGDKFELDELRSRRDQFLVTQVQPRRERGWAVVAQALRVGYCHQEQVKRRCARATAIDEVPLHERLINPTELIGHLA